MHFCVHLYVYPYIHMCIKFLTRRFCPVTGKMSFLVIVALACIIPAGDKKREWSVGQMLQSNVDMATERGERGTSVGIKDVLRELGRYAEPHEIFATPPTKEC